MEIERAPPFQGNRPHEMSQRRSVCVHLFKEEGLLVKTGLTCCACQRVMVIFQVIIQNETMSHFK